MKLIVLDDKGVINEVTDPFIQTPEQWVPIPGSLEAIAKLTHQGYRVIVATNQSGIGRGLLDMDTFNAINNKLFKALQAAGGYLDALFFCPHAQQDHCRCRKPEIGLFKEIIQRYSTDLKGVPVVGDSLKDLQAASSVGATPILVLTGNGQKTQAAGHLPVGTQIYPDLASVANALLK